MEDENNMDIKVSLYIGGFLTLIIVVSMAISVIISWIASLMHYAKNASPKKKILYFVLSLIGLFLFIGGIVAFYIGSNSYDSKEVPPAVIITIAFSMTFGFLLLLLCGLISLLILYYRRKNETIMIEDDINYAVKKGGNKWLYTLVISLFVLILISCTWFFFWEKNAISNQTIEDPLLPYENNVDNVNDMNDERIDAQKFYPFEENGKSGMKDVSGKIIVPAEYDKAYLEKDIIIATKDGEFYFFDENKQIFSKGAINYSFEKEFLTATADDEEGLTMEFFPKTKLTLEDIDRGSYTDGVFLSHFTNGTYSFYTIDGETKVQGLSNDIFCLKQIDTENGHTINTYYGFCNQKDNDYFMAIYDEKGNRKCVLPIKYWQLFGIDHLTKDESEYLDYDKTFTFTIDIDDFIRKYRDYIHL